VTVTLRFNEGRACDAVLRLLEARDGAQRQAVCFPERESHEYMVELACHIKGQLYALEHTGIEPFTGHVQVDAEAKRRIQPLVERVAARLPQTEEFELQVPVDGLAVLRGKQLDDVHDTLAEWIERIAPTLPIAPIGRYVRSPSVLVPGVPFPVRLHRMTPIGLPNNFQVNLIVSDVESRRLDRLRKALSDKCPKLAGWKHSCGAKSVLILEQNDIQLTNAHIVTETLLAAEREISNRADEVYLVMTCIDRWIVYPLRVGDRSYFDITNPEDRAWEIDSAKLQDITKRPALTRRAEVDR
jgi:hypothetical protein